VASLPSIISRKAPPTAYAEKPFNTLDDVKSRTRLTGTNIEDLKKHGLFRGLPDSAQISIFDL
jgi:DNA polymerase-3 subunit alpha (Gram-positive type)